MCPLSVQPPSTWMTDGTSLRLDVEPSQIRTPVIARLATSETVIVRSLRFGESKCILRGLEWVTPGLEPFQLAIH